jgi:hypothetical protein
MKTIPSNHSMKPHLWSAVLFSVLTWLLIMPVATVAYDYPLYPYAMDYSQTMTYKLMLDWGGGGPAKSVEQALQYIKEVDNLTRHVPKIAILVGFQEGGHDWQYPAWGPVNSKLKRPKDANGREALRWLMKEAGKYHTTCTVHVNCFGAFKSSPEWARYEANDWISKSTDGTMVFNGSWAGGKAFAPNLKKMWEDGELQHRMDALMTLLPEILDSHTLYLDANSLWKNDASPYNGATAADQLRAFKRFAEYVRKKWDVTLIGEYCYTDFYGFVGLGLTWSVNLNDFDFLSTPPQLACGGKDYGVIGSTDWPYDPKYIIYGASVQLEQDVFHADTLNVLREFSYRTLPYFFMNKHMRTSYQNGTLQISDGILSTEAQLKQDRSLLRDGENVFIPEVWLGHPEILAFSPTGYAHKTWVLPRGWEGVTAVDIYGLTKSGPRQLQARVPVVEQALSLDLLPMQGKIVVPAGVNLRRDRPRPPSGRAVFLGVDERTQGDWKGIYGDDGYDIIGAAARIPDYATLTYNNSSVAVWTADTGDPRALQQPGRAANRIAARREFECQSSIDVSLNGSPREVDVCLIDWDHTNRNVVIDVVDADSQRVLASACVSNFEQPKYVRFRLEGRVRLRISKLLHENNSPVAGKPAFSGVFFGDYR